MVKVTRSTYHRLFVCAIPLEQMHLHTFQTQWIYQSRAIQRIERNGRKRIVKMSRKEIRQMNAVLKYAERTFCHESMDLAVWHVTSWSTRLFFDYSNSWEQRNEHFSMMCDMMRSLARTCFFLPALYESDDRNLWLLTLYSYFSELGATYAYLNLGSRYISLWLFRRTF